MAIDWIEVAKLTLPAIAVSASFLTPMGDEFFVRAMRRRKDSVKALIDEMYRDERSANALARQRSESNEDSLEFIRAAVMRQGEEFPRISLAVKELTTAVNSMTHAVEAVQEIATLARESNIRLEERVEAWQRQREEDRQRFGGEPPWRRASDRPHGG